MDSGGKAILEERKESYFCHSEEKKERKTSPYHRGVHALNETSSKEVLQHLGGRVHPDPDVQFSSVLFFVFVLLFLFLFFSDMRNGRRLSPTT